MIRPAPPHGQLSRRDLIEIGFSTALGTGVSSLFGHAALGNVAAELPKAKSVLFLFLFGGPSHVDTFDMKPKAPEECRSEFSSIHTSVPGLTICEHLPNMAMQMDRWSLVRSMSCNPTFGDHRFAVHGLLGGIDELPTGATLAASRRDWPTLCSGVEYFRKGQNGLPTSVVLPGEVIDPGSGLYPAQNGGFLGAKYDPFQAIGNPVDAKYKAGESLQMPVGMTIERLASKQALLQSLDQQRARLETALDSAPYDRSKAEAFRVLANGRLAKALSVDDEPASVRERYGKHLFGQTILVAKRLIEAGVPIVQANVTYQAWWDTHYNNFVGLRDYLPHLDRGVCALMDDLRTSGLLDETLVVMMGEFGRTPKLVRPDGSIPYFTSPGRDHWMSCFSGLFAGAGVRGGQVIGRSDAIGAYPVTRAYRHSDVAATVYSALGIDPASEIVDIQGRALRLNNGQPIEALYTGRES